MRLVKGLIRMTGNLPSQPKATILVVDDEAAVRRVLVMRLQLSGYRVICAEDGEQALEMFQWIRLIRRVIDECEQYPTPGLL